MSRFRGFLVIGAAVAAVSAVVAGPALARAIEYHEMSVQAPDGEVAHIRYAGNTAPQVQFDARPVADDAASPLDVVPFSEIERISAALDQQAADLMHAVDMPAVLNAHSASAVNGQFAQMPKGSEGYSFVSISSGDKTCTEKMSYDYNSQGKPVVEKTSSGDCSALDATGTSAKVSAKPTFTQTLKQDGQALKHDLKHDWNKLETSI